MRVLKIVFFSILFLPFMTSCSSDEEFNGETIDFGEACYYQPFLGVKSDTVIIERELKFDFNDYAKEKDSYVTMKLVDENNNSLNDKNILLYLDGNVVPDKTITLNSDKQTGSVKIGIKILPDYKEGYTSGFFTISQHNLNRINDNDLQTSNETRLFKWEAEHTVVMNPLKKGLLWLLSLVIGLLVLWFLIRNMIYPKFKKGRIQILEPYFSGINFGRGTKLIVLTNKRTKQSLFNEIFTGKIEYEVNQLYDKEIELRPRKGNKIKIKLPLGAKIFPPVVNLEKFQSYTLEINKQKIKIQYS